MRWAKRWRKRLRTLVRKDAVERELDEELAFHLRMETEKNLRAGMTPAESRRQAAIAFRGVERYKEEVRDARLLGWVSGLSLDFKLAGRMLVKYPGLTLVGGLSMAVAIAAGAATFEVVTQVVHPSLPLQDGDRIVGIHNWDMASNRVEERAADDFIRWRDALESVEDLGAFRTVSRNLVVTDERADPVAIAEITASGFRVAGVAPLLGRYLVEEDEREGAAPVLVIGYDVWRSRFASDPGVVGRTVRLGRSLATVVGVMPEGFAFPVSHSFWAPLRLDLPDHERAQGPVVHVFGRLAPGFSLQEAQAELTTVGMRAAADFPDTHGHLRPQVMPYAKAWSPYRGERIPWGALTAAGYSINAAVLMFLLLVSANVATLVFARTATRESEIVVRSAIGASRSRIGIQLFAEALVLGCVAAALGLAAAAAGLRWGLRTFGSVVTELPFWIDATIAPRTMLYAGVLTVLGAAVAGVIPALKVTGRGMQARLRQAAVGGATLRFGRLWTGIIVTQVAVTAAFLPLVIGGALDTNKIRSADLGFPADEYLSAWIGMDLEAAGAPSAESSRAEHAARLRTAYEELERRLETEPGVLAVTFAAQMPGAHHRLRRIELEDAINPPSSRSELQAQTAAVGPGFFDAFGAAILAGRGFHSADLHPDASVVIVNESFVRDVLGGRSPIGRRVRYLNPGYREQAGSAGDERVEWYEVVGVVRQLGMDVNPDLPHAGGIYHPLPLGGTSPVQLAVHLNGEPETFAPRLRALAMAVDPTMRLSGVQPLDNAKRDLLVTYTFWVGLAVLAAGIVLLLSTTGIYSLMAFTVSRRTREIGIRVALGADRKRIVRAIFSRAFLQVGLGMAIGAALLGTLAGGIQSWRAVGVLAAALVLMTGVSMLACIVPTRRALRVPPTDAMRADA